MRIFKCVTCLESFNSKKFCKNRIPKYCSKACYAESLKQYKTCKNCGCSYNNYKNKFFCSADCKNKNKVGKKLSTQHRLALSIARKNSEKCKGKNLYNWKGGASTQKQRDKINNLSRYNRMVAGGAIDTNYLFVLKKLQRGKCFYCERRLINGRGTHIEHLLPLSKGGTNIWYNLVYSCQSCNNRKKDKSLAEFAILKLRPDWINKSFICYAANKISKNIGVKIAPK